MPTIEPETITTSPLCDRSRLNGNRRLFAEDGVTSSTPGPPAYGFRLSGRRVSRRTSLTTPLCPSIVFSGSNFYAIRTYNGTPPPPLFWSRRHRISAMWSPRDNDAIRDLYTLMYVRLYRRLLSSPPPSANTTWNRSGVRPDETGSSGRRRLENVR